MRIKLLTSLAILFSVILLHGCGTPEPPPPPSSCIEPDPGMQALFLDASRDNAAFQALSESARADRIKGVQQSFVFVSSTTNENRWQLVLKLYEDLALSKDEMLQGILPCLESGDASMDEPLRTLVLPFLVSRMAPDKMDFSFLKGFLGERRESAPLKLVKILYQASPGSSLELLASIYIEDATERGALLAKKDLIGGDRLNLLFDQNIKRRMTAPGVKEALIELCSSPEWWVRLYAAEVVGHTRGFSDPEITSLLAEDSHELVREAIALQMERKGRG